MWTDNSRTRQLILKFPVYYTFNHTPKARCALKPNDFVGVAMQQQSMTGFSNIDWKITTPLGETIRHSAEPNLSPRMRGKYVYLIANTKIPKDSPLTVSLVECRLLVGRAKPGYNDKTDPKKWAFPGILSGNSSGGLAWEFN